MVIRSMWATHPVRLTPTPASLDEHLKKTFRMATPRNHHKREEFVSHGAVNLLSPTDRRQCHLNQDSLGSSRTCSA